jgi:hypothetical protein
MFLCGSLSDQQRGRLPLAPSAALVFPQAAVDMWACQLQLFSLGLKALLTRQVLGAGCKPMFTAK